MNLFEVRVVYTKTTPRRKATPVFPWFWEGDREAVKKAMPDLAQEEPAIIHSNPAGTPVR